jgi:hypothetical protein
MSGRQPNLASLCCQGSQQQQMRAQQDVPENPISTNDVIELDQSSDAEQEDAAGRYLQYIAA